MGILFDLLGDLCDLVLEVLTGCLTITDELLILSNVSLQVIEHLELFIKSDQSVQFVLKFDLFLLECKLQLGIVSLVKQVCRIMLSCRCHSRDLLY